jgi:hypothetical protein
LLVAWIVVSLAQVAIKTLESSDPRMVGAMLHGGLRYRFPRPSQDHYQ